MKKKIGIWLIALLAYGIWPMAYSLGQVSTTPNLGLSIINPGTQNWGPIVNQNFVILDSKVPTLNMSCADGQVPAWAGGKFSICTTPTTAIDQAANYNWTGTHAFAKALTITGKQVCLADGTNCPSAGKETDPVISALNGFVTSNGTTPAARSMATADTNNIGISNQTGSGGNPTWIIGPNVALTTRSFTLGNFDFDLGGAASLTMPKAVGGTTTTEGRIITNTTTHRAVFGNGTVAKTFAFTDEIQPLNTNLTGISGVTFATNQFPLFHGAAWTAPTLTDCRGATDVLQFNSTTGLFQCTTLSVSGLSGGTNNQALFATGATTFASTSNLTLTGSVVNMPGGAVFGNCGTDCITWNTGAYSGHGAITLTTPYVGGAASYVLSTGALTTGHVLTVGANGQAVDGGAAGTGDVTLNGVQVLTNKTLDEAGPNTIKTTKSVQLTAFGPSEDNTTGNSLAIFRVPVSLNGTKLIGVQANVTTAGTTGTLTFQVTRCAAAATGNVCSAATNNMLTTAGSIDSGENSTSTAATPLVIDSTGANVTLATDQIIQINVSAIHGTPAKGLLVNLDFKLP